jgi:hypothetical protein
VNANEEALYKEVYIAKGELYEDASGVFYNAACQSLAHAAVAGHSVKEGQEIAQCDRLGKSLVVREVYVIYAVEDKVYVVEQKVVENEVYVVGQKAVEENAVEEYAVIYVVEENAVDENSVVYAEDEGNGK